MRTPNKQTNNIVRVHYFHYVGPDPTRPDPTTTTTTASYLATFHAFVSEVMGEYIPSTEYRKQINKQNNVACGFGSHKPCPLPREYRVSSFCIVLRDDPTLLFSFHYVGLDLTRPDPTRSDPTTLPDDPTRRPNLTTTTRDDGIVPCNIPRISKRGYG